MAGVPEGEPENAEPLKYKTWVLKVSIHCEGCKRKVKRILHNVEGVYTIDVDTKQHKVIVTGNVDANTLIRKLEKSGKHAELWPDFYQKNSKKNDEQNYQDQQQLQQQQQQQQQPQNQNQNPNVEKPKVSISVEEQQQKEPQKVAENSGQPQMKEVRFEENIPANGESQKPPANNGVGGGGGGAKKKKKKKKGQSGNNNNNGGGNNNNNNINVNNGGNGEVGGGVEHGGNGGVTSSESHPPPPQQQPCNPNPGQAPGLVMGPGPGPGYMSPPRYPQNNRVYEYPPGPPPFYAAPPVYAVSYNTAYPSSSYSASYYSAPPPYSYAYMHHGGDMEPPAPLDWNPHAVPPSDSFEMFSDENPNACSLM